MGAREVGRRRGGSSPGRERVAKSPSVFSVTLLGVTHVRLSLWPADQARDCRERPDSALKSQQEQSIT